MRTALLVFALVCDVAFAGSNFDLNAGTFQIIHNRPDFKLERLWIQTACFNSDGTSSHESCAETIVDGRPNNDGVIEFLSASNDFNQINTKDVSIRYDQKTGKFFCIGMKVIFEGFPNRCDEVLYQEIKDRYSILSFCTVDKIPENTPANARFSNRRLATWSDFSSAFVRPIQLHLTSNDRPDWCDQ